jgi:alkylated DNA repair dioxygenase AlkB
VQLTGKVSRICGLQPESLNSANFNKYAGDKQSLYWHSDGEALFRESETRRDTVIISLSFGSQRTMCFRKKYDQKTYEVLLKDGDITAMLGRTQDEYQHCIKPADASQTGSRHNFRYNITWRIIRRHAKGCPLRS